MKFCKCLLKLIKLIYVVLCAIWYHSYNLKNLKNTHRGVLILVKLQAEGCNFSKSDTPRWVFFTLFKLYKMAPNRVKHHIYENWKDIGSV